MLLHIKYLTQSTDMRLGLTHLKVANALAYSGKASKVLH